MPAAVTVVAKSQSLLGADHPLIGAPTGGSRTVHGLTENIAEAVDASADLLAQLRIAPAPGVGLPAVVVPGMQANFMAGGRGPAH
ncbi:hypothetical protein D3C81_1946390 [compost metagenome]